MSKTAGRTRVIAPAAEPVAQPAERAGLTAWRQRHALRRSSAAQPIASQRTYRRGTKHRGHEQDH